MPSQSELQCLWANSLRPSLKPILIDLYFLSFLFSTWLWVPAVSVNVLHLPLRTSRRHLRMTHVIEVVAAVNAGLLFLLLHVRPRRRRHRTSAARSSSTPAGATPGRWWALVNWTSSAGEKEIWTRCCTTVSGWNWRKSWPEWENLPRARSTSLAVIIVFRFVLLSIRRFFLPMKKVSALFWYCKFQQFNTFSLQVSVGVFRRWPRNRHASSRCTRPLLACPDPSRPVRHAPTVGGPRKSRWNPRRAPRRRPRSVSSWDVGRRLK